MCLSSLGFGINRSLIGGNRLGKISVIRVKNAELQVSWAKLWIKIDSLLQQRLHLFLSIGRVLLVIQKTECIVVTGECVGGLKGDKSSQFFLHTARLFRLDGLHFSHKQIKLSLGGVEGSRVAQMLER